MSVERSGTLIDSADLLAGLFVVKGVVGLRSRS